MLFDSSVYAVVSVQNDISILRQAFRGYGNSESWADVRESFKSVNYGNNKFDYVQSNFETIFGPTGDKIIDYLQAEDVWGAVEIMADELLGISWVKAPFVIAMMGYTEVMCIDTNVEQMVPNVKSANYSGMSEYKEAVGRVKDEYPELADEVSTFMLQWVVFDANRGDGVAKHEEWFEHMLPGTVFGRQTGLDAY
jgi:thermostable 8-oxoguanine DNA glycosylase